MKMMVVWLRLLGLPIQFWSTRRLLGIMEEAERPLAIDNFTN